MITEQTKQVMHTRQLVHVSFIDFKCAETVTTKTLIDNTCNHADNTKQVNRDEVILNHYKKMNNCTCLPQKNIVVFSCYTIITK